LEYPTRFQRKHLLTAENLIIYYWKTEYNAQGHVSLPPPTCLVSSWFKKDGQPRRNRLSFLRDLPDVIWYDGDNWRGGNLNIR
jgi:hypothetical protein